MLVRVPELGKREDQCALLGPFARTLLVRVVLEPVIRALLVSAFLERARLEPALQVPMLVRALL